VEYLDKGGVRFETRGELRRWVARHAATSIPLDEIPRVVGELKERVEGLAGGPLGRRAQSLKEVREVLKVLGPTEAVVRSTPRALPSKWQDLASEVVVPPQASGATPQVGWQQSLRKTLDRCCRTLVPKLRSTRPR
jgi:hypothetical protein